MAKLLDTPQGPMLCSRVNAGSLEPGDMTVSSTGTLNRITSVRVVFRDGIAYIKNDRRVMFRMPLNTPVWRVVGGRSAGVGL